MKVDIIRKFKWYIVGFILVAIMLSVSLSFCTWDSLSLQIKMSASKSGGYYKMYRVVGDVNGNKIADVGDIVTFGNYYQELTDAGSIADKSAIRWIVVHSEDEQLTLLAERVMAFGSFWGTSYYNSENTGSLGANASRYQNYSKSTLRAWLNSNYTLRNDGGAKFKSDDNNVMFRGFLNEAFDENEKKYIMPKTISNMMGFAKDNNPSASIEAYADAIDLVWVPSWSEVYGTTQTHWELQTIDGSPNRQFGYYEGIKYDVPSKIFNAYTTAFASSQYSNYTWEGATGNGNYQMSKAGDSAWYWLRSPSPYDYNDALVFHHDGIGTGAWTSASQGGVRPAICIPL